MRRSTELILKIINFLNPQLRYARRISLFQLLGSGDCVGVGRESISIERCCAGRSWEDRETGEKAAPVCRN
jgi:hypothetical protein